MTEKIETEFKPLTTRQLSITMLICVILILIGGLLVYKIRLNKQNSTTKINYQKTMTVKKLNSSDSQTYPESFTIPIRTH